MVYVSGYEGWIFRVGPPPTLHTTDPKFDVWYPLYVNSAFPGSSAGTFPHPDSRHLAFLNSGMLLETDDGGIYGLNHPRSPGTTDRWVSLNSSIEDTEFFQVAYDETTGEIVGGTQDNGTVAETTFSPETSGSWNRIGGGDGGLTAVDPKGVRYYFADKDFRRNGQEILMEAEPGLTFGQYRFSGLTPDDQKSVESGLGSADAFYPFALSPVTSLHMAIGLSNVYESTDGGDIIDNITPSGMKGSVTVYGIAFGGSDNPNAMYVATDTGQLFVRSTSGGGSVFTKITKPKEWKDNVPAQQIVVAPDNYKHAFFLDTEGHVWETKDAGVSWKDDSDNLVGQFQSIAFYDPTPSGNTNDGVLLAGTLSGVFRRFGPDPNGLSWRLYGLGMPNALATTVQYAPQSQTNVNYGDTLLVGTFGRGAWTVYQASQTLTTPGVLHINGDEGGYTTDDYIILQLDPNRSDYIQAIVNNVTEYDGPYSPFSSIVINGISGGDVIDVKDVPLGVAVTTIVGVPDGSQGTAVNVGKNHSVSGIKGTVDVTDPSDYVTLNIDASADVGTHDNMIVTNGAVSGLAPGTISYRQGDLAALNIQTFGRGNNQRQKHAQ